LHKEIFVGTAVIDPLAKDPDRRMVELSKRRVRAYELTEIGFGIDGQDKAGAALGDVPQVDHGFIIADAGEQLAIVGEDARASNTMEKNRDTNPDTYGILALNRKRKQALAGSGIPETKQPIPSGGSYLFSIRRHGSRINKKLVS
jgi:hypothetical protein